MRLGDYIDVLSGYAFKSKQFNTEGEGIQVVRIRDVGKERSETYYEGEYKEDFILNNGDLLIGMDGDFRLAEWKGGKALLNQRVCKITVSSNDLYRNYLKRMLPRELKRIEDTTSFATVKHLSVKKINDIDLPLPPLEEQKKIAAILDAADDYRQKTKALIDKYDQLTQSLFQDMFGDPVINPKGWEVKLVKDVAEAKNGYAFKSTDYLENGVPLIRMSNFSNGPVEIKDTIKVSDEFLDSKKGFILKNNDFVIALSGATTGKYGIYLHDFPSLLNQRIGLIRAYQNVSVKYLHEFLKLKSDEILKMAAGAAQPNVSLKEIQDIKIPIPPENLQQLFATSLDSIMIQKQQAETSLIKAEELFSSLLQRAFKGELTS